MRYFEDFQVGERIELGSLTVTEEEIIAFARQFDPQPFHISPEQEKHSFYLISGVCIPIGLLFFGLDIMLAGTPTPGAALMVFVLASLLFIGGVVIFIIELVVRHVTARPR